MSTPKWFTRSLLLRAAAVVAVAVSAGTPIAAHAQVVTDRTEADKALRLLMLKYPQQASIPVPMPTAADVRIFRVTPKVISVLDYSKGFAHTDLVTC